MLLAVAPTAAAHAAAVTIRFDAATTTAGGTPTRTVGTFALAGRFGDAGNVTTTDRVTGAHLQGVATLIGARGILTIELRGMLGPVVDGHQSRAGQWRVCGGTGAYRRASGGGTWDSVAEFGQAPPGMAAPAMHGVLSGWLTHSSWAARSAAPCWHQGWGPEYRAAG
jgi:hypothetical protein